MHNNTGNKEKPQGNVQTAMFSALGRQQKTQVNEQETLLEDEKTAGVSWLKRRRRTHKLFTRERKKQERNDLSKPLRKIM